MTKKAKQTWTAMGLISGILVAGTLVWYFFIREKMETTTD